MLLFEHKQYLQSYDAESSMQTEIFLKLRHTIFFNTDNNNNHSWATNQHIRVISEGSCDTEDWSNNAENSALHNRSKLHFKIH